MLLWRWTLLKSYNLCMVATTFNSNEAFIISRLANATRRIGASVPPPLRRRHSAAAAPPPPLRRRSRRARYCAVCCYRVFTLQSCQTRWLNKLILKYCLPHHYLPAASDLTENLIFHNFKVQNVYKNSDFTRFLISKLNKVTLWSISLWNISDM